MDQHRKVPNELRLFACCPSGIKICVVSAFCTSQTTLFMAERRQQTTNGLHVGSDRQVICR